LITDALGTAFSILDFDVTKVPFQPDIIWASPPCTGFSVAAIGHHWSGGKGAYIPKTEEEAYKVQIDAMQTAVYMKYKTINGYSSSCHGNFGPFWNNHDSTSLKQWLTVFHLSEKDVLIIQ
jgi:hypothetical protein